MANCDANKARELLQYNTKYNISDSIDDMILDIKNKGARDFMYKYDIEINSENVPLTWKDRHF